jgi:hypothetical protein
MVSHVVHLRALGTAQGGPASPDAKVIDPSAHFHPGVVQLWAESCFTSLVRPSTPSSTIAEEM